MNHHRGVHNATPRKLGRPSAVAAVLTALAAWSAPASADLAASPPTFVAKWGGSGTANGQFMYPQGVEADPSGNVYVTDCDLDGNSASDSIEKFTPAGTFVARLGSNGAGNGQFGCPTGLGTDRSGNVYVGDCDWMLSVNNSLQKLTGDGAFVAKWGAGEVRCARGVTTDPAGNVYVADSLGENVREFSPTGSQVASWGGLGSEDGKLDGPHDVAVDAAGNVYVTDWFNLRVQKFTSTGAFLAKWGSDGTGDGQFKAPGGIAVDAAGFVYVVDTSTSRVQKFTAAGVFVTKWGSEGTGDGQLMSPNGIATDAAGNIYVVDSGNDRVQKFTYAPTLVVGGNRTQHVAKGRALRVTATCRVAGCAASARARIGVSGAAATLKVKSPSQEIAAGGTGPLRLKLTRSALRAIRRALGRGAKVRARITVEAQGALGPSATAKRTIKLDT